MRKSGDYNVVIYTCQECKYTVSAVLDLTEPTFEIKDLRCSKCLYRPVLYTEMTYEESDE